MLNALWIGFFLVAFGAAVLQYLGGDPTVFAAVMKAAFDSAKTAFEVALGLTGVMCLWLGVMKIGEQAGFLAALGRWLAPLFARLFPEVPKGHPALGSITMNMAANVLGLDNAATPMGLKAMRELQDLNPSKDTASNAQILFLVLNASSVTLLPVTIFTYRAQLGAADPTDVFIPILMATYASTLAGFLFVAAVQRIRVDGVVLAWLGGITAGRGRPGLWFASLPAAEMTAQSSVLSNFLLLALIVIFLIGAALKRVNAYEAFIEGAKEGFHTAVTIIPYLVAMLVAIGMLRASGALPAFVEAARAGVALAGLRHGLGGGPAHHGDETVVGFRRARHDDRDHAGVRRGFLRRAIGQHRPGQHRDHLLRAGRVLRLGGHQAGAPRGGRRPDGGPGRLRGGGGGGVSVLRRRVIRAGCCSPL
jgi:spore maturation protein SpmA